MRKVNSVKVALLLMTISMLLSSCTTTLITYAAENIKGNAVMDEANMLADYGKFAIQYTTKGDVTIINKTDSMMYIDMAESYYVLDGTAQQLYTNSVTTNFSSGSRGASVNLGSVTNALGVGGVVGTLAQGVNVGRSNTNGSSTQVFEERYISIPPMSRKAMKSENFWLGEKTAFTKELWERSSSGIYPGSVRKKGTFSSFEKGESPMHEYIFAYTFDSNASKFQSTRDLFYVSSIEGDDSLKDVNTNNNQYKCTQGITVKGLSGLLGGMVGVPLLLVGLIFLVSN